VEPMSKASGTKRLKLEYDEPQSKIAVKFNLRCYTKVLSLERLAHLEDKNLLAGNILILFEREDCYDMVGITPATSSSCLPFHHNACDVS